MTNLATLHNPVPLGTSGQEMLTSSAPSTHYNLITQKVKGLFFCVCYTINMRLKDYIEWRIGFYYKKVVLFISRFLDEIKKDS